MKSRPTIKDVATRAGLSLSTVSLAVNNSGYVSKGTREKVLKVVEELGYHPSHAARGLASRRSGNIGFILTDDHFSQAEPFYTKVFLGTEFEARKHNYYILLTTVGRRFTKKNGSIPRFLLERNIDGVIIAGKISEGLVNYIQGFGLPVMLVDYELPRHRLSTVLIDNRKGGQLATQHLISTGHRDIGFICGDLGHPSIRERFAAFKETLVESGHSYDEAFVVTDEKDNFARNGYEAGRRLLSAERRPSAVFAANDAMAIGCLQYAREHGINVPDDLAIVGFDNVEMSSHVDPGLTTVHVFKEELGVCAVRRLVDMVHSRTQVMVTSHVPVALVVRESTGGKRGEEPQLPPE